MIEDVQDTVTNVCETRDPLFAIIILILFMTVGAIIGVLTSQGSWPER